MVLGYAIVFAGATLVAEGWRTAHRVPREGRLATEGVYARVRHPQYTGFFLIIFGEGIVHWPTIVSVAAFPIIVVAYSLLARREERQMLETFGDEYRQYQRRVPMFIPLRRRTDPGGVSDCADSDRDQRRSAAARLRARRLESPATPRFE